MFRLLKYLRPYLWQCLALVAATGLQVWGTLQLPTMMSGIVNEGIVKTDYGYIWGTGLLMLGIAFLSTIGALASSYFSARIGTGFGRDLRRDVFKKILSYSINEIDDFSTASLITRTTNDIAQVQGVVVMMFMMMLRVPLMATGSIIQAISLAPDMTWILALAVALLLFFVVLIMSIVIPKFKLIQKMVDKITLLTRENLTGLRVIRAFNNQKVEEKKFAKANNDLTRMDIFVETVMSVTGPLMSLLLNGVSLLCIWIGVSHLEANAEYLGKMMAFMQYATHTIMSFLFLTILFVMLPRANVSAGRLNEVLRAKNSVVFKKKTEASDEDLARINEERKGAFTGASKGCNEPSVEFKNVSFSYSEKAEEAVLRGISFVAKAGQTTAIIGSTGSGKSTVVNLIPRFRDVTMGEVLVDGINVRDFAKDDLMRRIGYVPQKGFLFSGTVRSNILFGIDKTEVGGNEDALDKRMKKAAEIAQAAEFVEKMPDGYESKIIEAGTNVSGGQRQRLSIARAVAKDPEIYIFDDAFSALDMKTDKKLRAALKPVTRKAVTIIVAQRISTIKDADQIVVIDDGKLVAKGTHGELLVSSEVYREIVKSQLSDKEFEFEMNNARKGKK